MKYRPIYMKDGRIQHVPIVVKNKDVLIGYIRAYNDLLTSIYEGNLLDLNDQNILAQLSPIFDSSRFNDYVDDGVKATDLTKEQFEQIRNQEIESYQKSLEHPDNKDDILDVGFFSVDCVCGNFMSFKTVKDIPETDFKCDLCERTLIQYIRVDDEDIEVDGQGSKLKDE